MLPQGQRQLQPQSTNMTTASTAFDCSDCCVSGSTDPTRPDRPIGRSTERSIDRQPELAEKGNTSTQQTPRYVTQSKRFRCAQLPLSGLGPRRTLCSLCGSKCKFEPDNLRVCSPLPSLHPLLSFGCHTKKKKISIGRRIPLATLPAFLLQTEICLGWIKNMHEH